MKQVTLLGCGKSSDQCPLDGELWLTEKMFPNMAELDGSAKVFDFNGSAVEIAQKEGIPIVSTESYATEIFPYEEIAKEYGDYFGSTVSYMLAYAIYSGYERICLYGIDSYSEWHYLNDKHYISYWLGVASGKGIKVEISSKSGLYRAMKENVKDEYERRKYLYEEAKTKYKSFEDLGNAQVDPFCFVSGLDPSAIKVRTYNEKGEMLSEWHHTT